MASVQKRGDNSWLLVVEAGFEANGKRIKRTRTVKADGVREARKLLAIFQTEVEAGEYIAPEKMTFSNFVEEWQNKYAESALAPLTYKNYKTILQVHILPKFGHMRMENIKPMHIVTFLEELVSLVPEKMDMAIHYQAEQLNIFIVLSKTSLIGLLIGNCLKDTQWMALKSQR